MESKEPEGEAPNGLPEDNMGVGEGAGSQHQAAIKERDGMISYLKRDLKERNNHYERLIQSLESKYKGEKTKLSTQMKEFQQQINSLNEKLTEKDKDISKLRNDLEQRIASSDEAITKKTNDMSNLKKESQNEKKNFLSELEKKGADIDKLKEEIKSLKEAATTKDTELMALKDELEGEAQLEKDDENLQFYTNQVNSLQDELNNLLSQKEQEVNDLNENLQSHNRVVASLEAELSQKNDEIRKLTTDVKDTMDSLEKKKQEVKQKEEERRTYQQELEKKEDELRNAEIAMNSQKLSHNIKMEEAERKLKETDERLRAAQVAITDCSIKWKDDRIQAERAVDETTQLMRLKDELTQRVQEVVAECEGFQVQLASTSSDLENIQQQKNEEITQLQRELQRVQAEHIDTVAGLRDRLDQSDLRQRHLNDLVTMKQYEVIKLQGEINEAHSRMQQMILEVTQLRMIREQMYNEGVALNAELVTVKGELEEKERTLGCMKVEREVYEERLRFSYMKIQTLEQKRDELVANVDLLKGEVERAEGALRHAYHKDEEKSEELTTNNQEKRRLVNELNNLRSHLESIKSENERLKVSCTNLKSSLQEMYSSSNWVENS